MREQPTARTVRSSTEVETQASTRSVSVVIDRMRMPVRTDKADEHVQRLVDYIDETIVELRSSLRNVNSQQLYLMTALRIAEELFKAVEQNEALREELRRRTDKLVRLLDGALATEGP